MIHFIVDSTFGVEEEYKKAHNIKVAGLSVMLDDKIYHDENLQEWQLYYEALKKSKDFPKTTQPSPEIFVNLIEQTLKEDPDAKILLLTITQTLSGTYNCAKMATFDPIGAAAAMSTARQISRNRAAKGHKSSTVAIGITNSLIAAAL